MSDSTMIRDGDDHKGGDGYWKDGHMHYTNYNNGYHTSYDDDGRGNISNVHSTDHSTREKTQHGSDSSVTKYSY